jgi:hypothetical protein
VQLLIQLYGAAKLSVNHRNNGLGLSDRNVAVQMVDKRFLAGAPDCVLQG